MSDQRPSPIATILTVLLLLFVGASVAYMVVGGKTREETTETQTVETQAMLTASTVVVRYFHASARCASCKWIEEHTKAVIAEHFADAALTFESLNYEAPMYGDLVGRYGIVGLSLVVVGLDEGEETGFKNLTELMGHIGDDAAFGELLKSEIASVLGDA